MLTVDSLEAMGIKTQEGLERCLNNEQFYFRLIKKSMQDDSCEKLRDLLGSGDLNAAFELAHSLKGVYGNLSLTPLYEAVSEITELLRARTQTDYSGLIEKLITNKNALAALCAD